MKEKVKILGIIPARGGSKSLLKKNIKPLFDKPVIAYTIEAAKESRLIDRLVVSTEDDEIASVAQELDTEVIKRPMQLAQDTSLIEDALRYTVTYLEKEKNYSAKIVVFMHANVPVRKKGVIDEMISMVLESEKDSAVTVYEITQRPEWMKIEQNEKLKPYLPPTDKCRRQDLPELYLIDGAVAVMRKEVLMAAANKRTAYAYLGEDIRFKVQEPLYSIEIDDEWDLALAEFAMKRMHENLV